MLLTIGLAIAVLALIAGVWMIAMNLGEIADNLRDIASKHAKDPD